jgi:hypothetical protein
VVFSSLGIGAMFAVCIIADVNTFKSLFGSPGGYLVGLVPASSWKILLPRLLTMTVCDMACYAVAIAGTATMGLVLYDDGEMLHLSSSGGDMRSLILSALVYLAGYAFLMSLIAFGLALRHGVFFGIRFRTLLALAVTAVAAWALNLLHLLMLLVGGVIESFGPFIAVSVDDKNIWAFIAYMAIVLCKTAVTFIASSVLYERRINL